MGKAILVCAVLVLLCAGAAAAALLIGKGLSPASSLQALFSGTPDSTGHDIVWKLRLPRLLLGLLVGAGLAGAGCVLQGMLRNPLADPFTLGISGGAALGATAVIVLFGAVSPWIRPGAAFAGAGLSALFVYTAASRARFSSTALILAGVILSFFFSSLVYLLFAVARPKEAHGALLWLMGDLSSAGPSLLLAATFPILLGLAGLWLFSRDLNALTLGDEKARSLGVAPERTRKILFGLASLATAAAVAGAGIIGFVGLMVPHFLRPFTGPDHRILLPASILGGAALLAWADTFARSIPRVSLPVGVVTGLLGGVFMLALLTRGRSFRFF
ncbi:MAG: FecCD family ABC transporter permease [Planctomycetota bacterium]|jgi:iron complex transport system permease protein